MPEFKTVEVTVPTTVLKRKRHDWMRELMCFYVRFYAKCWAFAKGCFDFAWKLSIIMIAIMLQQKLFPDFFVLVEDALLHFWGMLEQVFYCFF